MTTTSQNDPYRTDYVFVNDRPIKIHYPVKHREADFLFTKKSLNFYRHHDKHRFMSSQIFNPYHMTYTYSFTLNHTCQRWDAMEKGKKYGWRKVSKDDQHFLDY